jgi:transposase
LLTIVGAYSALTILAGIDDISRFRSPKHLCSYAGLAPSLHTGNTVRLGSITKQEGRVPRWILTQCTWMHLFNGNRGLKDFFWGFRR